MTVKRGTEWRGDKNLKEGVKDIGNQEGDF